MSNERYKDPLWELANLLAKGFLRLSRTPEWRDRVDKEMSSLNDSRAEVTCAAQLKSSSKKSRIDWMRPPRPSIHEPRG
jgi:hypothetical protein